MWCRRIQNPKPRDLAGHLAERGGKAGDFAKAHRELHVHAARQANVGAPKMGRESHPAGRADLAVVPRVRDRVGGVGPKRAGILFHLTLARGHVTYGRDPHLDTILSGRETSLHFERAPLSPIGQL